MCGSLNKGVGVLRTSPSNIGLLQHDRRRFVLEGTGLLTLQ
jgi:hypothetical protein